MINRSNAEFSMRMTRQSLLAAVASLVTLCGAARADAPSLLPHRAVYDVSLASVSDTSDIEALTGRWVFDFSGSACKGYTAESRLVMKFETGEGPRLLDRRVSSFEAADGQTFKFKSQSYTDQELEEEVVGTAARNDDVIEVSYTKPENADVTFGTPAVFPSGQVFEILEKARAGIRFYESAVFDGTEMVDDATTVSVVIGKPKPLKQAATRTTLGEIGNDNFLPVTMAYFEPESDQEGERVSDYDVTFNMHESGVQTDILIRYEEYSMAADLVEFTKNDVDTDCSKP